jgi:hypothetical protein
LARRELREHRSLKDMASDEDAVKVMAIRN